MRRREFIAFVGSTVATSSLAVRAQQSGTIFITPAPQGSKNYREL
jgi:hypothetical protein